ncbi:MULTISPECIES: NADase-type glycan-binding domain-containing protein [unclassified Streptomyces]|uniref:zinc ribbon domain-containing protein n=1 Tax=unclassified Streptomyces TaxID=2593676 RepID=UPI002E812C40|nr:zinc ribbon domain-containing protein [Streptomyces sp. NBC_00589]WTI37668.1 zinc ribbon domain-containing protein [Streptomyces sp. NBC_00775]WUB28653.1 zinc ribbon domain-containing protein [Streptomyces sp. NBC_00589]
MPRPTASEPPALTTPAEPPAAPDATQPEPPAATPAPSSPPAEEPASAAPARGSSLRTRLTGRGRGEERGASTAPAADSRDGDGEGEGSGTTSGQYGETARPAPRPGPDDSGAEPSAPAPRPTTREASRTDEAAPTSALSAAPVTHPAPATPPAPAPRNSPGPRPPAGPTPDTPTPAPIQPVRPAKPVAPRPVVRPAEVPDEGAGAPCPSCGTPNPPGRRFCRRCATALNPAAKPEPLPWWRTVWPFRRRVRASSGRAVRLLVILAVVVALCAGALLLLPAGRALFEDTRDKLGKPKPVTPVGIRASAEVRGHPAKNTTDGLSNSYWGAPAPGASVTYTFGKPFRMVDLLITNGPSRNPEDYHSQARALQVDLEVTTSDGERQNKQVTLSDKPGDQTIPTGISDVKTVRLTLRSPVGLTSGRQLALAEVEFFQRS